MGVPDGNSKIATVAPLIISQCTLSPKISPMAPAVQAVGGGASDLGLHILYYVSVCTGRGFTLEPVLHWKRFYAGRDFTWETRFPRGKQMRRRKTNRRLAVDRRPRRIPLPAESRLAPGRATEFGGEKKLVIIPVKVKARRTRRFF